MSNFNKLFEEILDGKEEYRGLHTAPGSDNGSPLHDLSGTYPDDVYSSDGPRLYGHYGDGRDITPFSIIRRLRGRPNASVEMFRAIPKVLTNEEKIDDMLRQKRYILKHGVVPPGAITAMNSSEYYEHLDDNIEQLKTMPDAPKPMKIGFNVGDWVTIDRKYAKDHGESALRGQYRILKKTVKAKDLFTNGDSIFEWGYFPQS